MLQGKFGLYLERVIVSLDGEVIYCHQCVTQMYCPFWAKLVCSLVYRNAHTSIFSLNISFCICLLCVFLYFPTVPWILMDIEMILATWRRRPTGKNLTIRIQGTETETAGSWYKYSSPEGLRGVLHSEGGWSTGSRCS